MPLADRLVHRLAVVRMVSGAENADGHPLRTSTVLRTTDGFIWPMSAKEVDALSDAGAEVGDYSIVVAPQDITAADWMRRDPDDGRRFEIKGRRHYDFGRDPLLQLVAKLVTGSAA